MVKGVESREISGEVASFYVLEVVRRPAGQGRLMVPVDAGGQRLRRPMSSSDADGVLTTLAGRKATLSDSWQERFSEVEAKIRSGRPIRLAEVVRDLDGEKSISVREKDLLKDARRVLCSELAHVKKVAPAKAEALLESALKRRTRKTNNRKSRKR